MIKAASPIELERVLQRYGDDLYRMALLLAGDMPGAARGLLAATRQLAGSAAAPSEPAMLGALLAALPREARPWRRTPAWARSGGIAEVAPLLAAFARLPRQTRFALGLASLRAYHPAQIAPLLDRDELAVREQIRDALLALARYVPTAQAPAFAQLADLPEDCRPTRAALGLADPRLHSDGAIRGHLALCSACRAAEQDWMALTSAFEAALRNALREVRLPNSLAEQLQQATHPASGPDRQGPIGRAGVRIALVALPVLALIAVLVWPHGTAPTGNNTSASAPAQAPAPIELVRRAETQLYAPPPGSGVWHSRYAIQWVFANNSYATLNADEWLDQGGARHRLQLVHQSGGGPYEYELADGTQRLWYAATESYAASLYPLFGNTAFHGTFRLAPEQRTQMMQARLESGAWAIAANYLKQAEAAELQTWGRQRDADGRLIDLISFEGASPLAQPADSPSATASRATILLAIDELSGRLREVRELFGAAGSEQTARTTWKVLSEEWIENAEAANQAFDRTSTWNGTGRFTDRAGLASPSLPLLDLGQLESPTLLLKLNPDEIWMPAMAPARMDTAMLVSPAAIESKLSGLSGPALLYTGPGRRLAIRSGFAGNQAPALDQSEGLQIGDRQALLKPLPAQGYIALLFRPGSNPRSSFVTMLRSSGFSRTELIELLKTLGPPTLASFRSQAPLFAEQRPHDAAWQALLGALADPPQPGAGGARHFVEHVFKRRGQLPDPLLDPYHRPRFGGWPEQLIQDNWAREAASADMIESSASTRDAKGTIYARQYRGTTIGWDYDALVGRTAQYPRQLFGLSLNEDQYTVLQMLGCDGTRLETQPGGQRAVVLGEDSWHDRSCQNPGYPALRNAQLNDETSDLANQAPYMADTTEDTLTTLIVLGADGRPARTEVWAGQPGTGKLLESWERAAEEIVPAKQIPAGTFDAQLPDSQIKLIYPAAPSTETSENEQLRPATLAQAIGRAGTPLFGFSQAAGAPQLVNVGLAAPPEQPRTRFYSSNSTALEWAASDGYALYLAYSINIDGSFQTIRMYQGAANELGAYLRDKARWQSSAAVKLQIGEQTINGWQVSERNSNTSWLLFEVDGTLIAVMNPSPELLPILGQLQRLAPEKQ